MANITIYVLPNLNLRCSVKIINTLLANVKTCRDLRLDSDLHLKDSRLDELKLRDLRP